ncbi:MAG: Crp/Fnr family transcriptional regulator [Bacillota bacterium]
MIMLGALRKYIESFSARTMVFHEGDAGLRLYILLEGQISIFHTEGGSDRMSGEKKTVELARLEPGSLFGEMSVFTGEPRSASALCLTNCRMVVLSRAEVQSVIAARPEFALKIIEIICRRLAQTDLAWINAQRDVINLQEEMASLATTEESDIQKPNSR